MMCVVGTTSCCYNEGDKRVRVGYTAYVETPLGTPRRATDHNIIMDIRERAFEIADM
jgi:hypothetical protein